MRLNLTREWLMRQAELEEECGCDCCDPTAGALTLEDLKRLVEEAGQKRAND